MNIWTLDYWDYSDLIGHNQGKYLVLDISSFNRSKCITSGQSNGKKIIKSPPDAWFQLVSCLAELNRNEVICKAFSYINVQLLTSMNSFGLTANGLAISLKLLNTILTWMVFKIVSWHCFQELFMHKKYTQYNCFLECVALAIQKDIMSQNNRDQSYKPSCCSWCITLLWLKFD